MKTSPQIKAALDRAASMVKAKPAIGQRTYKSIATVSNGLACAIQEKEWSFASDTPESMGGDNGAPSPSTLFRAAVSGCVAMGIKMWAARSEIAIERIEVCFATDVDARGQFGVCEQVSPGFENADLHIRVVTDAAEADARSVIEASLHHSPMIDALKDSFPIQTRVEIHPTSQLIDGAAA